LAAVWHALTAARAVEVVTGPADTGKTYVLAAARAGTAECSAPSAELLEPWKEAGHLPAATEAAGRFLRDHTPR
jgi:hypothetical protein